jgi:hypothetical protein
MKKLITLIVFACLYGRANAQIIDTLPWCPPGATWIYWSHSQTSNLYYKFAYEKDTTIDNQVAKLLSVYEIEFTGGFDLPIVRNVRKKGQEYMRASGDSVYWYDDGRYKFIYSFAPVVGSNYEISNSAAYCLGNPGFPTSDTITVTTAYTTATFGSRSFQIYNTSGSSNWQMGTIINKIGGLTRPFPEINRMICNTSMAEYGMFTNFLVCYSDVLRGSFNVFSPAGHDCHNISTSIYEPAVIYKALQVYPNPVGDVLQIGIAGSNLKRVVIYNTLGNIVLTDDSKSNTLSLIKMPAGVYIIRATDLNDDLHIGKIIKQ